MKDVPAPRTSGSGGGVSFKVPGALIPVSGQGMFPFFDALTLMCSQKTIYLYRTLSNPIPRRPLPPLLERQGGLLRRTRRTCTRIPVCPTGSHGRCIILTNGGRFASGAWRANSESAFSFKGRQDSLRSGRLRFNNSPQQRFGQQLPKLRFNDDTASERRHPGVQVHGGR